MANLTIFQQHLVRVKTGITTAADLLSEIGAKNIPTEDSPLLSAYLDQSSAARAAIGKVEAALQGILKLK